MCYWQVPAGPEQRGGAQPSSPLALHLDPAAALDNEGIFQAERICPGTDGGAWKGKEGQPT